MNKKDAQSHFKHVIFLLLFIIIVIKGTMGLFLESFFLIIALTLLKMSVWL